MPFWELTTKAETLSLDLYPHWPHSQEIQDNEAESGSSSEENSDEENLEHNSDDEEGADAQTEQPDPSSDSEADKDTDQGSEDESEWEIEEQNEELLTSFALPSVAPQSLRTSAVLHERIAARTIMAAAQGGHLRHLDFDGRQPHAFAVRSMVPYWVELETLESDDGIDGWMQAAALLRPYLAHCSLWLSAPSDAGPRHTRHLKRKKSNRSLLLLDSKACPSCTPITARRNLAEWRMAESSHSTRTLPPLAGAGRRAGTQSH